MTSNNNEFIKTTEAAEIVGVSAPTLLRIAGKKVGLDGVPFPEPTQIHKKNFVWSRLEIERWVEVNGKAPPTNKGRPKGSTRNSVLSRERYVFSENPEPEPSQIQFNY